LKRISPLPKSRRDAVALAGSCLGLIACSGAAWARESAPCSIALPAGNPAHSAGIAAQPTADGVVLSWLGTDDQPVRLRLAIASGEPRIAELDIAGKPILRDALPIFEVTTGTRRISNQQLDPLRNLGVAITQDEVDRHKWDAFWDAPLETGDAPASGQLAGNQPPREGIADQPGLPRAPDEVERASAHYAISACTVSLAPARATITLAGVTAGAFTGALEITAYRGTNLLRLALVASTQRTSLAYKYDAGIEGIAIAPGVKIDWIDTAGALQETRLTGPANDQPVAVRARARIIAADTGGGGAIAALPPPHTFFWAREIETNVGNNWYRKDAAGTLGIGIRQAERELREEFRANWALYSAPPGTRQRMALYLFPAAGSAKDARDGALAFTRGDRYAPLPGFKVMAHHFHLGMGERLISSGSLDTRLRDFEALRAAGIDIASVTDIFPDQRNPGGPKRLEVLQAYYEGAARTSDSEFLVMPSVEATAILGGHWDVLMPHPTLWLEHRAADAPFRTQLPDGTPVYHLGSEADARRMIEETGMIVFMPHPRTKGSTHYPDAIRDEAAFNADFYRGAGWRWGMGADLSERRLSEKRVLPLFDDMNEWMAARGQRPKYLLAISETFDKEPGDDIYANNPVNYLKLAELPRGRDYSSVIDVLSRGDYFVTSGEVLIPDFAVETQGSKVRLTAQVSWTFPLDMAEVVWGDGKRSWRKVIDASGLPAFGSDRFVFDIRTKGARWMRFAAWDSAGNGAMTQPIVIARSSSTQQEGF